MGSHTFLRRAMRSCTGNHRASHRSLQHAGPVGVANRAMWLPLSSRDEPFVNWDGGYIKREGFLATVAHETMQGIMP